MQNTNSCHKIAQETTALVRPRTCKFTQPTNGHTSSNSINMWGGSESVASDNLTLNAPI